MQCANITTDDDDGRKVDAIVEGKENTEEILKRWLQGDGLQFNQEPGEPSSKFCGSLTSMLLLNTSKTLYHLLSMQSTRGI